MKKKEKDDNNIFYDKIINTSENGIGKEWFVSMQRERNSGYNIINRKNYKEKYLLELR